MEWLEGVLESEYETLRILKNTPEKQIKVLRHRALGQKLFYRRFVGDDCAYRALLSLAHPNLPRVYQVSRSGAEVVVLEEFVEGMTVFDVLETGCYTEDGVRTVAAALCDALSCLHERGIIHRDIKPENVMIAQTAAVKLLDFDAARIYKPYRSGDTRVMGTAGYAAPEQLGVAQTDPRTDIYSLGILMNVMLTGEHPARRIYRGKLSRVIEQCIATDPQKRFQSAAQLKSAL